MEFINILLIEDNPGDILLTQEMLEEIELPHELESITNGEAAIDHLTNISENPHFTRPDLILLDINIPKKNGHEILSFTKNNSKLKEIPVFILTTSSSPIDMEKCRENNAQDYFIKPLEEDRFREAVIRQLNFNF
ncbi:response regulator [Christiangramia salexigens]|uniref:Response regulatory domain-containing protein n=1 Tax=Christiangramia salexigens TaxID=1913577 RepID=A0A1L3J1P4_9FLAO|nr:response regulator [Christiangramia salexigens]APG59040.1 hypothetical protein LPB144_00855 [Christiangramia salexigens]